MCLVNKAIVCPQRDWDRPKCSTYRRRGSECSYREKADIDRNSSEIIDALQSMSQRDAFAVLRSLRATRDPGVALKMARSRTQPSEDPAENNQVIGIGAISILIHLAK